MILLVRHGETTFNAARIVQPPDTPLSERGVAQAERLAEHIAQLGAALVLSSDLSRARHTAEHIARAVPAPLELSALLQERNFGQLRGRPYAELTTDIFAPDFVPPGGEDGAAVARRAAQAFALIAERAQEVAGNLVVVSHGLFCAALVAGHTALPAGMAMPAHFANASLTRIERSAPYRVLALNDVAHLAGLAAPGAPV